eukprot:scaffold3450_cov114-Cylindrotheca_fusiformis.AAC.44
MCNGRIGDQLQLPLSHVAERTTVSTRTKCTGRNASFLTLTLGFVGHPPPRLLTNMTQLSGSDQDWNWPPYSSVVATT